MPVPPRLPEFDIFAVLGVAPDNPPDVVKAAWRQRVKEHHPDASGGSDAQIKRINVAYDWLRDPTLRQTYLLAMRARQAARPRWGIDPFQGQDPFAAAGSAPADPYASLDPDEPPAQARYDGPRADRIDALTERILGATMPGLLDLVHGYRPDLRWSLALARAIEASGLRGPGAAAVWQVRRAVRERIEVLLQDERVRATYDEELVGQVVSDRLADLVRAIVLLDVLTPDARRRVAEEWDAVMGPEVARPGDEPALGAAPGALATAGARWARAPESFRLIAGLLAAAVGATAASALLPPREAVVVILLGFGAIAALLVTHRRSGA